MPDGQYLASIDGEIMPKEEAVLPVTDEGLIRGDGVFEVMRIYDGVMFAAEEHYRRLERSARNMRLPVDLELVRSETDRLLATAAADGPLNDSVRIMCTRGGRRIVMTEPLYVYPERLQLKSVEYAPTLLLDGIKSLSYGANRLASRLAQEQGYDEALLVTPEGQVLEAPTSSIFYVHDGVLCTPPLSDHILASITRQLVIDTVAVTERSVTLPELADASEVFLASTMREVAPIARIDAHEYETDGPVITETTRLVGERRAELLKGAFNHAL
jgi:branched-chain amino acid aminotransferase